MTWKSGKHLRATYGNTKQQFWPNQDLISRVYRDLPSLEIEPATTETLTLSQQSTSHTSDGKLTSHGNRVAN